MKVCLAIEKFDASVGGAERYCWDLAHYLIRQGHEVSVICMRAAEVSAPIRIIKVHPPRFPQGLRHLGFALLQARAARSMPDWIHFGVGNTYYMDVYQPHGGVHRAWFLKETLRCPASIRPIKRLLMRLSFKDMVQRAMEWWVFKVTRPEVIAISEMAAADMQEWFGFSREYIHLVPNGIDTGRFLPEKKVHRPEVRERYGLAADDFVFLFVAQNLTLKGFDLLVDTCRRLAGQNFKVLVIGPAGSSERKAMAGLEDHIILAGRAADMDLVYPACDCLVHPTYYDTCSLVVLEALASALPVITTTANGAAMFLRDEDVIDPASVEALVAAMRTHLSERSRTVPECHFHNQNEVFSQVERIVSEHVS